MKKLFHILTSVAVGLFLFVALLLLVSSIKLPGFPLDARTVLTGSMEPSIPTGSVVFIYPRPSYGVGDVVTYKRKKSSLETPITHRIIAVETDESGRTAFTTKGDGNENWDLDPVYPEEVYGKVLFHIPFMGRLLDASKTPWGFAAFIVIPAVLVIADEVKKIVGQVRRRREDEGSKEEPKA